VLFFGVGQKQTRRLVIVATGLGWRSCGALKETLGSVRVPDATRQPSVGESESTIRSDTAGLESGGRELFLPRAGGIELFRSRAAGLELLPSRVEALETVLSLNPKLEVLLSRRLGEPQRMTMSPPPLVDGREGSSAWCRDTTA